MLIQERDGITAEHSKEIWELYARFIEKNILIEIAEISPIRSTYEWVGEYIDVYKKILEQDNISGV